MLFCSQLIVSLTIAQVQISGKITNAGNQPLPGISRHRQEHKLWFGPLILRAVGTISAPLKPGSYTLEFSGCGFQIYIAGHRSKAMQQRIR